MISPNKTAWLQQRNLWNVVNKSLDLATVGIPCNILFYEPGKVDHLYFITNDQMSVFHFKIDMFRVLYEVINICPFN